MEYDTNFGEYKRRQKLGISPLIFTHLVAMFIGFSIAMTVVLSFIDQLMFNEEWESLAIDNRNAEYDRRQDYAGI